MPLSIEDKATEEVVRTSAALTRGDRNTGSSSGRRGAPAPGVPCAGSG